MNLDINGTAASLWNTTADYLNSGWQFSGSVATAVKDHVGAWTPSVVADNASQVTGLSLGIFSGFLTGHLSAVAIAKTINGNYKAAIKPAALAVGYAAGNFLAANILEVNNTVFAAVAAGAALTKLTADYQANRGNLTTAVVKL